MGPEEAQLAHAQRIREATEQRRADARSTPEDKLAELVSKLDALRAEVDALKAAAKPNIQVTGGAISGVWPNITITFTPTLQATAVCNGDGTITIHWN